MVSEQDRATRDDREVTVFLGACHFIGHPRQLVSAPDRLAAQFLPTPRIEPLGDVHSSELRAPVTP